MNPTQFTYTKSEEILSVFSPFIELSLFWQILFIALILILIIFVFYAIPFFISGKSYIFSERERLKKKSMLKQIMLQREIEEEVEREIKEEEISKK